MNLVPYDDNNLPKKADDRKRKLSQTSSSSGKVVKNSRGRVANRSSNRTSNRVSNRSSGNVVNCGDYSSNYDKEREYISENNYTTDNGGNNKSGGWITLIILIVVIFGGCHGNTNFSPDKKNTPSVTKTIDENITTEKAFIKDFPSSY